MAARDNVPVPARIEALSCLDDLEDLAEAFARTAGYEPELLSHWDPKLEFQTEIAQWRRSAAANPSPVPYAYSSYLDLEAPSLKSKLREGEDRRLMVTASGTTSIAAVAMFLRSLGVASLRVVTPSYFAIEALCSMLAIETSFAPVRREEGRYHLPCLGALAPSVAVWLTVPVFGASSYIDPQKMGAWIDALPSEVVVIVDESLAFVDRACLSFTKTLSRVIRIATPNKALCINGEKVSFISADARWIDGLNDWSECVSAGLSVSSLQALRFFQTPHFDQAVVACRALLAKAKQRLLGVLSNLEGPSVDEDTDGHFVMLYWPKLAMDRSADRSFMMDAMSQSGAAFIPASRNRHPEAYGLSFRVNLLRLDNAGLGALRRLALFFEVLA